MASCRAIAVKSLRSPHATFHRKLWAVLTDAGSFPIRSGAATLLHFPHHASATKVVFEIPLCEPRVDHSCEMMPMRMTLHTDYALRTLIYLATRPDEQCTVNDVAEAYQLSRNHLLKVAQTLRGWRRLNLI